MKNFGSRADARPLDSHTLFKIGSITKIFTGVCFAQLLLESVVKRDDSIDIMGLQLLDAAAQVPLD